MLALEDDEEEHGEKAAKVAPAVALTTPKLHKETSSRLKDPPVYPKDSTRDQSPSPDPEATRNDTDRRAIAPEEKPPVVCLPRSHAGLYRKTGPAKRMSIKPSTYRTYTAAKKYSARCAGKQWSSFGRAHHKTMGQADGKKPFSTSAQAMTPKIGGSSGKTFKMKTPEYATAICPASRENHCRRQGRQQSPKVTGWDAIERSTLIYAAPARAVVSKDVKKRFPKSGSLSAQY